MPMMSESDGSLPFGGPGCVLAVGLPWGSLSGPGGCWTGSVISCSHTGALWDWNSSETAGGFETCPLLGPDPGGCSRSDGYPRRGGAVEGRGCEM